MATVVRVRKWGNSLAVRLPRQFAAQRALVDGSAIEIDDLKIVRAEPRRRSPYKLKDMLKNYTRPPKELDFAPVGKELA
jgi:antitoxin MazE